MAKNKNITTENDNSVTNYLNGVADEKKRKDCIAIIELIQKETKLEPKMWGTAIVGFGSYHYKYESGREGDAPLVGLSARAKAIVLYLSLNEENRSELLPQFGKHKTDKGCIYVQKLEDIDITVLKEMVHISIYNMKKKHGV